MLFFLPNTKKCNEKKTRCDDHLGLIEKKLLRNIVNFKPIRSRALANWKKANFLFFNTAF